MAGWTFVRNSDGFQEALLGPEVTAAVLAIAQEGKTIAEGLSADFVVSGEYESSFEVGTEIVHLPGDFGGTAHDAVVGIIHNTSDHAVAVEYGYQGRAGEPTSKAHRVFGRMLAALSS